VDEVLRTTAARSISDTLGYEAALDLARRAIESARSQMKDDPGSETAIDLVHENLQTLLRKQDQRKLKRVINATGVIIHTNLGRSPLSSAAVDALTEIGAGYCNVELELETGERGRRGHSAESLLAEVTGAEDGLIVNNCSAAALLVLSALAEGGEVIVSRGELVEIGGDFRIPEVLERSGCRLREVGTTNRTKLADYERAIASDTKAILRVHPSNYRITGFTVKPLLSDLARLAGEKEVVLLEDAGSGALLDLSEFGLGDEPVIRDSIAAGADIVTFSGDKLVGGVQAGLIVGQRVLINKIRSNPLYRAVRADKLVYAAVEATLRSFARGTALEEIPTLRMICTDEAEIRTRAESLKTRFETLQKEQLILSIEPGYSAIGGGTGPGVQLPTSLIAILHRTMSASEVATYFRFSSPPIITRIDDGRTVADLRTMSIEDENVFLNALIKLSATDARQKRHA
jgi:L-seryl-tRNA(Ser) seleniumtransferase